MDSGAAEGDDVAGPDGGENGPFEQMGIQVSTIADDPSHALTCRWDGALIVISLRRLLSSLLALSLLTCGSSSVSGGRQGRLQSGQRIDTLLVDVERIAHGVPPLRASRYTLVWSPSFRRGWIFVSGADALTISVPVEEIESIANLLALSNILDGRDTSGAMAPDGESWRVQARLNEQAGVRCFIRTEPEIVRAIRAIAGDRGD